MTELPRLSDVSGATVLHTPPALAALDLDLGPADTGGATAPGPVASNAPLAFAMVRDATDFDALEAEWSGLFRRHARPEQLFQAHAWLWHWCRHYATGTRGPRLAIVTGRRDGRLVLVLPLALMRRAGLKQLVWAGEPVSQYNDALAAPEAADTASLRAAFDFAVRATGADLASLRKVRADAFVAPLLEQLRAEVVATEEAPVIDLAGAGGHTVWEAGLPAKGRKNRRRYRRRLEEHGTVTLEVLSGDAAAGQLASYAVLMKRAWLKAKDRISLALADDRFAAFFADVAAAGERGVGARVLVQRVNGEITAIQVAFDNGPARFLHLAVYAPKFEKCGVGGLLLEDTIADAGRRGLTTFDLLAPKHPYKLEFTETAQPVHDWALAVSLKGRAWAHGWLGVRRRLKAIVENMPAPMRRAVSAAVGVVKRGA